MGIKHFVIALIAILFIVSASALVYMKINDDGIKLADLKNSKFSLEVESSNSMKYTGQIESDKRIKVNIFKMGEGLEGEKGSYSKVTTMYYYDGDKYFNVTELIHWVATKYTEYEWLTTGLNLGQEYVIVNNKSIEDLTRLFGENGGALVTELLSNELLSKLDESISKVSKLKKKESAELAISDKEYRIFGRALISRLELKFWKIGRKKLKLELVSIEKDSSLKLEIKQVKDATVFVPDNCLTLENLTGKIKECYSKK